MEAPLCKICDPPRRHWSSEAHLIAERAAKKSMAALKEVHEKAGLDSGRALPVVPQPMAPDNRVSGGRSSEGQSVGTQARPIELTKRGTPRQRAPKGTGFDRKAYQREKAKLRRARLKDG